MRQLYTSPRPENIDTVVALMHKHGIETSVQNRSNYRKQGHQRFSYVAGGGNRASWAQVWVTRADDYTQARALLREIGIEPVVSFQEELERERHPSPQQRRQRAVTRTRRLALVAVLAVLAVALLRFL